MINVPISNMEITLILNMCPQIQRSPICEAAITSISWVEIWGLLKDLSSGLPAGGSPVNLGDSVFLVTEHICYVHVMQLHQYLNIKFCNDILWHLFPFSLKLWHSIFRSSYDHVFTVPFKTLKAFMFKTCHLSPKDIIIYIYALYNLKIITWQLGYFF